MAGGASAVGELGLLFFPEKETPYCGRLTDGSPNEEGWFAWALLLHIHSPTKSRTKTATPMARQSRVLRTLVVRRRRRRDFSAGVSLVSKDDSKLTLVPPGDWH